jgi:hypothetical protein
VKRYLNPTLEIEIRSEYSPIQQSNNGRQDKHSKREIRQMPPSKGQSLDCQAQDNKELNSSGAKSYNY